MFLDAVTELDGAMFFILCKANEILHMINQNTHYLKMKIMKKVKREKDCII
jgi:hypothetical protein